MPDSMSASQSLDVSTVYFEFLSAIFGRYSKPIGYLILALLALGIAYLTFLIVRGIYRSHMRKKFYRREGIELPSNVLVKVNRDDNDPMIELHFPYWTHSNKNGTRDKRYSSNPIVLPNSTVVSSHWILKSNSPINATRAACCLRRKGEPIPFCEVERNAYLEESHSREIHNRATNLNSFIRRFSSPFEFESYCADLLNKNGWIARTTRATADGGFDIEGVDPQGRKFIAECKLFTKSKASRPAIQKLVGAAQLEKADRMLFFSPSGFTVEAEQFASAAGCELFGFSSIANMHNNSFSAPAHSDFDINDFEISNESLYAYYPDDYR